MLHPAAPILASPTKTRTGTSFQRDRESSPGDNSLACPGFFPMEFVISRQFVGGRWHDILSRSARRRVKYPAALTDLVEKGYIRRMPKDSVTGSAETWVLVQAMDAQGQQAGIYDVKSGSDATASDGTRYSDW